MAGDGKLISYEVISSQLKTIEAGQERVEKKVDKLDDRMSGFSERVAVAESKTEKLGRDVIELFGRANSAGEQVSKKIKSHASDCPGNQYARYKLNRKNSDSEIPRPGYAGPEDTTGIVVPERLQRDEIGGKGVVIPRWVVWTGAFVGAAFVGAVVIAYVLISKMLIS